MKKSNSSFGRWPGGLALLIAILVITVSCTKSSSGSGSGPGADEVWMQNLAYNPATITVTAGSTVTWTNKDNVAHTVTSDTGLFDSGDLNPGDTFTHTFATAGTYAYHCTIHTYMHGTVVVQAMAGY